MRVYNHEITIRRGEAFTVDKTIRNQDGSPYIIPKFAVDESGNDTAEPYFVITVSDAIYPNADNVVYRQFLRVKDAFPTFRETNPVDIRLFTDQAGNQLYPTFKHLSLGPPGGFIGENNVIYTDDDGVISYDPGPSGTFESQSEAPCTQALFYTVINGVKEYRWWTGKGGWQPYECRLSSLIPHDETINWKEGNYYYSIDLIDDKFAVTNVYPILAPTKLSVLTNLRGGNIW